MHGDTLNELKARIVSAMDVTTFLDFLGLDLVDIIDLFDDEIENEKERLDRACR